MHELVILSFQECLLGPTHLRLLLFRHLRFILVYHHDGRRQQEVRVEAQQQHRGGQGQWSRLPSLHLLLIREVHAKLGQGEEAAQAAAAAEQAGEVQESGESADGAGTTADTNVSMKALKC